MSVAPHATIIRLGTEVFIKLYLKNQNREEPIRVNINNITAYGPTFQMASQNTGTMMTKTELVLSGAWIAFQGMDHALDVQETPTEIDIILMDAHRLKESISRDVEVSSNRAV